METVKFDRMGVFAYSQEENTLAAEMKHQIDEETKIHRRDTLMEIQREISLKNNLAKVGGVFEVIVDEREEGDTYLGENQV